MGLLKSFLAAPRSVPEKPQQRQRYLVPMKTAGMVVDHETALKYSAVWRCINLISSMIATMPWHVHEIVVRGGRTFRNQASIDNPVDWILHRQANPEMSALDFRRMMIAWKLMEGNAYAEIERDRAGRVAWLWPLVPERVKPDRDSKGNLVYVVNNSRAASVTLEARDVYHLRGLGFDGLMGYSVLGMAARSIGIGLASEEFCASYFSNGITPSGVLEHPQTLSDSAFERLKKSLREEHGGGPSKAHSPLILEEGMVWKTVSAKPEEAQLLENRRFQVSDIARWFGVPLVLLEENEKNTSWGTGIEQVLIGFNNSTLRPIVISAETEGDIKLFGPQQRGRMFTKINMNALMRGDSKSRGEWYKTMHGLGVFSVNEIRELEDMNPIGPEGDKRLVPLNMITLEKAGEQPTQDQAGTNRGNGGTSSGDGETNPDDDETRPRPAGPTRENVVDTQRAVLLAIMNQISQYEQNRCKQFCARYEDRTSFVKAMDKFYPIQERHLRGQLSAPISALVKLTLAHAHPETVVDACVERHIQLSRLAMLDAFDNQSSMQPADPATAVQQIMEAVL